jgi:hypothetical protein
MDQPKTQAQYLEDVTNYSRKAEDALSRAQFRLRDDAPQRASAAAGIASAYAALANAAAIAAQSAAPAIRDAEVSQQLAAARTEAIADVGDWLDDSGQQVAAYLVRTVDIPAAQSAAK